ncbi:MAG TPA: FecR domain-containing protein [Puia sp.]|nr:FecR domain-containing protein [Puia sp.]
MEKNRFWELLARVKSGEATPEEQLELSQHLSASPEDIDLVKQLDAYWELPMPAASAPSTNEITTAWDSVRSKIISQQPPVELPARGIRVRRMIRYASAIAAVLITTAGICLWNVLKMPPPPSALQKNIVSTKNGSRSKIELPDGTQVWLNVGSRINYDENYGKENRELTLTGEAYFDVAHNANTPFILHTGKMDVKVLGTVFNVKAYPGDVTTEAALIKGSIEVTFPGRPHDKLILKPHDKISIVNKEVTAVDTPVTRHTYAGNKTIPAIMVSSVQYEPDSSAIIETAWAVNNRLIFRSKTFEELARDIERWFNVTVRVEDSSILSKKFTGTFSNESISDALYALSLSYPFHYRVDRNTNTVIIN